MNAADLTETTALISTLVLALHWLIVLGLSLRIIARRLPESVALGWLAVIFSVPFVGAAAYLTLGEKRLGRQRAARHATATRDAEPALAALRACPFAGHPPAGSPGEPLCRQTLDAMNVQALDGNRLDLLTDFEAVFDAMIRDIDAATTSCCLAVYIWHDGGRADDVATAMRRAASRGVRCRVLIDAVGSRPFREGPGPAALRADGVEVAWALPASWRRRSDLRYHRKIVVIDDRVAYAGSQNLVDPRFFKEDAGVGLWVDAVVRMEGPAVTLLANIFETDWYVETGAAYEPPRAPDGGVCAGGNGDVLVQAVPSGPAPNPDAIRPLLLTAIYAARRTLTLTTPYFVPDAAVLTALYSVAQSGVAVTLIVPAKNDSFLVRYASVSRFDTLLAAGVRIALFEGGLLHTKSLVVDEAVSLFGSVNLDMRSFWLNFECSLLVYSPAFAERLGALHRDYLAHSTFVDRDAWGRRPAHQRFLEDAIRLAGPLL